MRKSLECFSACLCTFPTQNQAHVRYQRSQLWIIDSKLRTYLESSKGHWGDLQPLRLWFLAKGGVESLGTLQDGHEHGLREEGANTGLYNEVENEVKAILWFDECHITLLVEVGLGIKGVSGLNAL